MRLANGMYDSRPEPGVFKGVARCPSNVKTGSSAWRVITKCQEVEDILAQLIDGDIDTAEARGRYLTIEAN